jgi:hypothetical protein
MFDYIVVVVVERERERERERLTLTGLRGSHRWTAHMYMYYASSY